MVEYYNNMFDLNHSVTYDVPKIEVNDVRERIVDKLLKVVDKFGKLTMTVAISMHGTGPVVDVLDNFDGWEDAKNITLNKFITDVSQRVQRNSLGAKQLIYRSGCDMNSDGYIYVLYGTNRVGDRLVYVGKTIDIYDRIHTHMRSSYSDCSTKYIDNISEMDVVSIDNSFSGDFNRSLRIIESNVHDSMSRRYGEHYVYGDTVSDRNLFI